VLDEHFTQHWDPVTGAMGTPKRRATRKRKGLGNWRLVRYADDFVLLVSGDRRHAEALRAEVAEVLAPLGLRLSEEKTRAVHIDQGFDFLGFHIRRMRKRGTQKRYVYTTPSRKSVKKVRDGIREKTYRSTLHMDLDELIVSLNRSVRGWANHFRYGVSKAVFNAVDHHMWWRVAGWICRKHDINRAQLRRRFCDRGWRIAHNGAVLTGASSVAVTRYRYRGANIPTPWTLTATSG
jgi:RNA-directed DNA polymerase